jgi:drug efflux transport system permease protein
MWRRLRALIIKELLAVLRDPRGRIILIGPPLLQMFLFSYAATLDVTNIDIGVLNRDAGRWSTEFVQRVAGAPSFRNIVPIASLAQAREAIDNRRVIGVISFDQDFSRQVAAHEQAPVQVILDGRRSNASQIVLGYLIAIANSVSQSISLNTDDISGTDNSAMVARHWFNSNLIYMWFTVPSLLGTLGLLIALVVTGQSVARERELGTFDQLMVSPLRVHEILIGKMVPPLIIGVVQQTAFLLVAVFFFQVPFRGSLILLYIAIVFFLASVIGVGLFISSLAMTQQQAFLGTFLFASPAILLSGFATPVENMPQWLQIITEANPLRHFLVIIRGVFLKGMPAGDVAANILPLILIAACTLSVAAWLFRQRIE